MSCAELGLRKERRADKGFSILQRLSSFALVWRSVRYRSVTKKSALRLSTSLSEVRQAFPWKSVPACLRFTP
jgi:hypothetical protein